MTQGALRVLLVEDSRTYASMLDALIKSKSSDAVEIFHKSFIKHALSFLKEKRDAVDVVLLDLGLPDTSSDEESFTRIRDAAQGIPVIVLTGRHDRDFSERLIAQGACAYVNKDEISANPDTLLKAIESAKPSWTGTATA